MKKKLKTYWAIRNREGTEELIGNPISALDLEDAVLIARERRYFYDELILRDEEQKAIGYIIKTDPAKTPEKVKRELVLSRGPLENVYEVRQGFVILKFTEPMSIDDALKHSKVPEKDLILES